MHVESSSSDINSILLSLEVDGPLLPNSLSVFGKDNGNWDESQSEEAKQGVTPAQTQRIEQRGSSKRKQSTDKRSGGCQSRIGRRSVQRITIDNIGLHRHEDAHHSNAKWEHSDDRNNPKDVLVSGPAVPEKADRQNASEDEHGWHAHLRLELAAILSSESLDHDIACPGHNEEPYSKAKSNSEIGKTGETNAESISAREDVGDRGEEKVEKSVNKGLDVSLARLHARFQLKDSNLPCKYKDTEQ